MADDFLTTYAPLANDIATATKLDPSVVLGIIDTETGHGQHVLGNNIFGISPGGRVAQYPDVQTGSQAFVSLMQTPRYASVAAAPDPASQAAALVKSGYNTVNPKYAATVAANAQNAAKVLGYEDNAPATEKDKALADPALQTTQQPEATTTPSASTDKAPSEKDKALADPALQVTTTPPTDAVVAATAGGPEADPAYKNRFQGVTDIARGPSGSGAVATTTAPATPTSLAGLSKQDIINALQPDPNMIYGSPIDQSLPMGGNPLGAMLSPFARDPKTGLTHLTLPPAIRSGLLGLAEGPGPAGLTYNPQTGTMNLTPEALAAAQIAANPLRFGGKEKTYVPPGTFDQRSSPLAGVNALNPELAAKAAQQPEGPTTTAPTAVLPPTAAVGAEAAVVPPAEKATPAYGTPSAAGADVTQSPIPDKTPAQRLTDLGKDVTQTAEERAGPQMVDNNAYVTGVPERLLASRDFSDSQHALDEKVARGQDPAFRNQAEAVDRDRNMGMVDLLRTDAGDPNTVGSLYDARDEVSPQALKVFEDQQPVDAAGMLKAVDDVLNGPEGKRKAVQTVFSQVRNSLVDADGNLETLPSMLYGARKNVTDLLKAGAKGTGEIPDAVRATKSMLQSLLPTFDETITGGAPKFSDYLHAWREASVPIDQQEFLQKYQTGPKKITDGDGYLQPTKVQKMLDDIYQGNQARGANPAKSLTEQQIQNVVNVRNELAAQKLRDRLASVRGSDTFQQINRAAETQTGPLGTAVRGTADLATHALLLSHPLTAGYGNALLGVYQGAVRPAMRQAKALRQASEAAAAVAARKSELLQSGPEQGAAP